MNRFKKQLLERKETNKIYDYIKKSDREKRLKRNELDMESIKDLLFLLENELENWHVDDDNDRKLVKIWIWRLKVELGISN